MNALDYLRSEIKSYYPQSAELTLSQRFASHRRFNFYFSIEPDCRFLLYLNWDGDGEGFTLKCLEFNNHELLSRLMTSYHDNGFKAFNAGKPKTAVSFLYRGNDQLYVHELKGTPHTDLHARDISASRLMECVNPL
ncbi:hypothetical protein [Dyadobacter sandarakinus]|uniref:Uncharacterized protein n=1 Tax=Dyadobacter sandarakinus TaxID=2747268 RepID=A0ABX7I3C1_9BACT|nr:hypothetical protein [Dyadobacter sandarakinus]QRR00571.1 hypothetical protein HWI92_06450 [Dyadobacter sandarakinus]